MTICYLSLGSNLRSPERQLRQAFFHLQQLPKTTTLQISPLHANKAIGRRTQPPFINCVIKIRTALTPALLLRYCLMIEKKQQRVRKVRWGARTLDIDILLYGNRNIRRHNLIIPHPRMYERDFVLLPLSKVMP